MVASRCVSSCPQAIDLRRRLEALRRLTAAAEAIAVTITGANREAIVKSAEYRTVASDMKLSATLDEIAEHLGRLNEKLEQINLRRLT